MILEKKLGDRPLWISKKFKADADSIIELKKYPDSDVVPGDGVIMEVDSRGDIKEIRYLIKDDPDSYLTGFIRNKGSRAGKSFHISSIQSKDKKSAYRKISRIFDTALTSLATQGVRHLDTNCVLKLAPLLMSRYSFKSVEGLSIAQVRDMQRGIYKYIPGITLPLERSI